MATATQIFKVRDNDHKPMIILVSCDRENKKVIKQNIICTAKVLHVIYAIPTPSKSSWLKRAEKIYLPRRLYFCNYCLHVKAEESYMLSFQPAASSDNINSFRVNDNSLEEKTPLNHLSREIKSD